MRTGPFYSVSEKILFAVIGYENSDVNIDKQIENLERSRNLFIEATGINRPNDIMSFVIEESSRYKYMRVVYIKLLDGESLPPDTQTYNAKFMDIISW